MVTGIVAFCLLAWGSVHLLNHASDGWYSHYAFGTTTQLGFIPRNVALFLPMDIVQPLPVVIVLLLLAAIVAPPRLRSPLQSQPQSQPRWFLSDATAFYGFITLMLLGAICFVRGHAGANINAVIPAYAWLAALGGLAIDRILTWLPSPAAGLTPRTVQIAGASLWLALSAQLIAHVYQPGRWIPQPPVLAYRKALLDAVRNTPGDLWLVNHSFDGILAGKPVHPEMDALDAVLGRPYPPTLAEFHRLIDQQHFSAILLDRGADSYGPKGTFTSADFEAAYGLRAEAPGSDQPDASDQPHFVYLPCSDQGQTAVAMLPAGTFKDVSHCSPEGASTK